MKTIINHKPLAEQTLDTERYTGTAVIVTDSVRSADHGIEAAAVPPHRWQDQK